MSRIDDLFKKKKNIVSIYFPAGYPKLNSTCDNLIMLQNKGVDMVEIGIPFSDPLADGPVIQRASKQALKQGMNLKVLFNQLENIREKVSIPLVFMGYWNVVWKFGVRNFLQKCKQIGIDGVIFPDLPLEEYQEHYQKDFAKYNVKNILLICPQTSDDRLQTIIDASEGFVYIVSSSAITGTSIKESTERAKYFEKISHLKTNKLIGFGITNKDNLTEISEFSNGGIIGSAFIEAINNNNAEKFIESLL